MIIDSDDDEPPPPPPKPKTSTPREPSFEEDEDEEEASGHGPPIVQYLDLVLGVDTFDMSFPPFITGTSFLPEGLSSIASRQMILAAACFDGQIRVITIPLLPPSASQKTTVEGQFGSRSAQISAGSWHGQVLALGSQQIYGGFPTRVALTFSPGGDGSSTEGTDGENRAKGDKGGDTASKGRNSASKGSAPRRETTWDVLVASVSSGAIPMLLVHRIPLVCASSSSTAKLSTASDHATPLQTQDLPSIVSQIYFNPSPHPAERHSQLLVVGSTGCVRIYDCCSRGARAAPQSPTGQSTTDDGSGDDRGSWLLSLYTHFADSEVGDGPAHTMVANFMRRKQVVDAKWVLGGKAVVALLSDGQWGVWDIEGAGPAAARGGGLMREVSRNGIKGGAVTPWNVHGRIDTTAPGDSPRPGPGKTKDDSRKLVPRTPRTRKTVEKQLFGAMADGRQPRLHGGISVRAVRASPTDAPDHESIAFRFDERIAVLPDLWAYWENQVARRSNAGFGNLLDATAQSRLVRMDELTNRWQGISDVDIFPWAISSRSATQDESLSGFDDRALEAASFPDALVARAHHLVMVSSRASLVTRASSLALDSVADPQSIPAARSLGVEDIDVALDNMERRRQNDGVGRTRGKVAFATPP